ncbi:prophage endopeptidase tail family protein [Terribacillus sp. 179-K 1B1 HS]|uniref:prophage endopeptidase tail family protein n=1 Tax=Terribacillus sp. 179-K 1B1 HS TaxID=3142388 RepID=UPI0039A3CE66
MAFISDLNGNAEILTGYDGITRTRRVNGEREIDFTLYLTEQNEHYFHDIGELWRVEHAGRTYVIDLISDAAEGDSYSRKFGAVDEFFFNLRNAYRYGTYTGSATFNDMLTFILDRTGYTFNIQGTFYARSFENFGDDTVLSLFTEALERYKSEFEVRDTMITLRPKIGSITDFQYRYQFNLNTLTREVDAIDFSTYGEGFGKDGLHVTYRSPLADIYGFLQAPPIRDERFTNRDNLLAEVKAGVDNSLKMSVAFDFEDLRAAGYPYSVPNEGDTVLLIDERFEGGLALDTRIVEIVEMFDEDDIVQSCSVTLSNFTNFQTQEKRMQNATKKIERLLEGKESIPFEALDAELRRMAEAIFATESQVEYNENGIVARTKDNPNHMLVLNSAGILISTDNGQTARMAITADGIATELLTAGSIYTNNIKIVGDDTDFYWDGEGLIARNPMDRDRYVKLNSDGLFINYGMLTVRGEAGTVIIDGRSNMHKILATGVVQMETAAGDNYISTSVYHGLGYTPAFSCYMQGDSTQPDENGMSFVLPRHILGSSTGSLNLLSLVRAEADANRLYLRVHRANDYAAVLPAKTLTFRYFIYKEVAF